VRLAEIDALLVVERTPVIPAVAGTDEEDTADDGPITDRILVRFIAFFL
jgi:hypothetical protein